MQPLPPPQYATIIDSLDQALIVIDENKKITLFNSAAQLYTGLSEKNTLGKQFDACFNKQPLLTDLVTTTLATGRSISSHETITIQPIGMPPKEVSINVSPLHNPHNTQQGAVIILHDQTRIRTLEKADRYADRLTMIETMSAGLAHEIKNPLGGIKGSAQLLELEFDKHSELNEYTQLIIRETERVNRIIEELLNLSTPRKTKVELIDIGILLDETIKLQSKVASDRGIKFRLQLDPSIPAIPGDRDLLMRLFINLIKNSCEATPDNSTITVATRIDSDYQRKRSGSRPISMIQISISDQGPGISATELEKIFTPFYTTKQSGNGLGLPICQKIIIDHEGQLAFTSLPAGGTKVDISLPLHIPNKNG